MNEMWKTRSPPKALSFGELEKDLINIEFKENDAKKSTERDQKTWSLLENFRVFLTR